ncbi:MAG: protein-glutamate O-methyltransferase CheR, partial [Gemmatimonadetes bacterium]|nr:protein-glutamate O-methyltransferase CheR [Gemmatimonadota bacterium]
MAELVRLLRERTGLVFPPERAEWVAAGVGRTMERAGIRRTDRFVARVAEDAALFGELVSELTVGETYFFREPEQLDFVRERVLPEIRSRRGPAHEIRCWSAACASGEEAYTLAILLREADAGGAHRVLGTDVSPARLGAAAAARYGPWSLRGVPERTARAWLQREGDAFRPRPEVRAEVAFRPLNLADDPAAYAAAGAWGMDLVLCRNVLIYLDEETVREVAGKLVGALAEDGWLFLGASDPPLGELVPCEVVTTGAGLAYRRRRPGARASVPAPAPVVEAAPAPRAAWAEVEPPGAAPTREEAVETAAGEEEAGWVARVRGHADRGELGKAEAACAAALDRYPACPELLYLRAVLLLQGRRFADAVAAARRALYLDRGLVVAHLALADALARTGDASASLRALRSAAALLDGLAPDAVLPASGGETAARLLDGVRSRLRILEEG